MDEPPQIVQIDSPDNKNFEVNLVPNLAQHILASGPLYTNDSLKIIEAHSLGYNTSGVLSKFNNRTSIENNFFKYFISFQVLGINKGTRLAYRLRHGAPIQTFEIVGKFGKSTERNLAGGRVTSRATFAHVTPGKLQALLSSMQATYQRQMFAMSGINIQSQEAYDLACKGLIRPKNTKTPVIYGIRSTGPVAKTFAIEVQTMNANEEFLSKLVFDIAIQLRTVAHCIKIRCTRYGYFTFEESLLRSQWNLENVLQSMHKCQHIWYEHPTMVSDEIASPVGAGIHVS